MSSPLAESSELVSVLQEALRHGDWTAVQEAAAALASVEVPSDRGEIAVSLDQLEHALVLARNARTTATVRLSQVRAASVFTASGTEFPLNRHNFGDSPESWHPATSPG